MDSRADLDELVDHLFGFAELTLKRHGEFYPFAAHMTEDGQVVSVAVDMDDDQPESVAVIDELVAVLRATPSTRAVGVCFDAVVDLGDGPTDAVRADLEHRDADPISVILPYRLRRLRSPSFGEVVAAPGEARVYA